MTVGEIGKLICKHRARLKLTQDELGTAIGKNARTISNYERNECDIPLSVLLKITERFGMTLTDFLNDEAKEETEKVKGGTEIRIYQLEDRMEVAKILIKNGYTVSQVKRGKEGQKMVEYRLMIEDRRENIRIVR